MSGLVHLKVRSEYSLLYSAARMADVVERAKALGMSALGFADIGGLYGGLTNLQTVRNAGLQPIMGMTVQVARERVKGKLPVMTELTLYATTVEGYSNLTKLASLAGLQMEYDQYVNTWTEIREHASGLLCLAGGRAEVFEEVRQTGERRRALRYLETLIDWFGKDRVYVDLVAQGGREEGELHQYLAELATELRLPLVATTEVRHLREKDLRLLDVLTGIAEGITLEEAAVKRPPGISYHLRSEADMQVLFAEYPGALATTEEIAERCRFEVPFGAKRMPHFPLPFGADEPSELRRLAETGLKRRLQSASPAYWERLHYELEVIAVMGFSGYFLIVWDFMKFAHDQGISTGPGRGSAAGSLVAYSLSITDVDPLQYNLLFERFLNPERVTWPDIDIDFETERRYEVIDYVVQKYGQDHVAQIGTLGTLAARAAVRDVARVLKIPSAQVEQVVRRIPAGPGADLTRALQEDAELRKLVAGSPHLTRLYELAQSIEGLPRHASVHAAGVVISREPIAEWVPLMRGQESVPVTQYDMEEVDAVGLLKMDFLGLRTLTICDQAVRYIRQARGMMINFEHILFNEATAKLLGDGDTDGCFQLESAGVKQVLREMKPESLEDLIAVVSLYRPGPMEQIANFLRARRGDTKIVYEVPELAPILQNTYGILVYQEQVMQIAAVMAGFSLGEADVLRRAIGKKNRELLDESRQRFVEGCLKSGFDQERAERVYDLIERFADYGFNRSHAAAYAMLALRTAYLKANYRPEFMAALMTESVSRPDKLAQYAEDCYRHAIPVWLPDLLRSEAECVPEENDGVIGIRLGFYAIKNVGVAAVSHLLEERRNGGAFTSVEDAFVRLEGRAVSKRVLESLVKAGAFSAYGVKRAELLKRLKMRSDKSDANKGGQQLSFVQLDPQPRSEPTEAPSVDDPMQIEDWERELIGFVVSGSARTQVAIWQRIFGSPTIAEAQNLVQEELHRTGVTIIALVGQVQEFRQVQTRHGELMAFFTLADGTGQQGFVVFPAVFRLLLTVPEKNQVLKVEARVEPGRDGRWIATALLWSEQARLFIRIPWQMAESVAKLQELRELLLSSPGNTQVLLVYADGTKRLLDKVRVKITPEMAGKLEDVVGIKNVKLVAE